MSRLLVIPAAGRGSRLGRDEPKALVLVNGRSMVEHLLDLYRPHVDHVVVIAHPSFADRVRSSVMARGNVTVAEQAQPTGMLDAIGAAAPVVHGSRPDAVWITWTDQIAIMPETLVRLAEAEVSNPAVAMTLPTAETDEPYIHFDRGASGRICGLRQKREGDVMPARGESDMGLFALGYDTFGTELPAYARAAVPGGRTGERNFLPFIPWLASRREVRTIAATDPRERIGVNTPEELAFVAAWLRVRPAGP